MVLLILDILLIIFSILNVMKHEKKHDKAFYSIVAAYGIVMVVAKITEMM